MTYLEWAAKWNIPQEALRELALSSIHYGPEDQAPGSESLVQSRIRLAAAKQDKLLYRNNRGAGKLDSGSFVRFGLANDSPVLAKEVKSADLIGLERVLITKEMVGTVIGRFLSVECKPTDWKFANTEHERAQRKWADIINGHGGRAIITNTEKSL